MFFQHFLLVPFVIRWREVERRFNESVEIDGRYWTAIRLPIGNISR